MNIQKELARKYPNAFFRMVIDLGESIVFSKTWNDWQIISFLQLNGWEVTIKPTGWALSIRIGVKEYKLSGDCKGEYAAWFCFDAAFAKIEELIVGKAVLRNFTEASEIENKK